MENIIEKLGLYDIFARGLTGIIVILAADLFGIFNLYDASEDSNIIPAWAIFIAGYFCGVVLEEMSYWLENLEKEGVWTKIFIARSKIKKEVENGDNYKKYNYQCCKDALIENNREVIADEPLAHIVMSASFKIAFSIFLFLKVTDCIFQFDIISDSLVCPGVDILILIVLVIIFHFRAKHYSKRRVEQIFNYCIAKHYPGIEREEDEHTDVNQ